MRIAYITSFITPAFSKKFCENKSYSVSATFKSTAIARAILKAGHEIEIFSPGITSCNKFIKAHTEKLIYKEGKVIVHYPNIISYHKCSFINSLLLHTFLKKQLNKHHYDILLYYNITLDAALNLHTFEKQIRILEYEDNIFNKALKGGHNRFEWLKGRLFGFVMKRTDAAIIAGKNMLRDFKSLPKLQIPGAIYEDVIENINRSLKPLKLDYPVKLLLAGGLHYSKGPDLIIKALYNLDIPCEIHFYGNGTLEKETNEMIKSLPKQHKVIIHGFLSHKELIRIMSEETHILVNSTRSMGVDEQSEGYPFKMLEYAATGIPIISSTIGKLDDEFNNLVNFYETENPNEIANVIKCVINNYENCVKNAYILQSHVLEEYSIASISRKIGLFIEGISKIK